MSIASKPQAPGRRKTNVQQVIRALDEYCDDLAPGERIPTRTVLMHRFEASERAVLAALDEMRRRGKIVSRSGSGTFKATANARDDGGLRAAAAIGSRTVVAIAQPDHSFFDRCVELLYRQAEAEELDLVCRPLRPETVRFGPPPPEQRPLGYVVFGYPFCPVARRLREAGCRVVLVGTPPGDEEPRVPCVYTDPERGSYLAARHLLELGHRRIGVGFDDARENGRWRGLQRALREYRVAFPSEVVAAVPLNWPEVRDAWRQVPELAGEYFRRTGAPSAVLAWNDHEAVVLMGLLSRAGIKVPEAVSVVGYDDLPEGRLSHPFLTTVSQDVEHQLQAALSLLTRATPPSPAHTVVAAPTLVCRESSTMAAQLAQQPSGGGLAPQSGVTRMRAR